MGSALGFGPYFCIYLECVIIIEGDGLIRLDGGVADKISVVEI